MLKFPTYCAEKAPPSVPELTPALIKILHDFYTRLNSRSQFDPIYRLFSLGEPLPTSQLQNICSRANLKTLITHGFAIEKGLILIPKFLCKEIHGLFIFSDLPCWSEHEEYVLPIGPASHFLARLAVRTAVESALDLGCGSGFQALLAARHSHHVLATDINPRALAFTRLNAALNRTRNISTAQGRFLEPVGGQRFDLILFNPPYILCPPHHGAHAYACSHDDAYLYNLLAELPDYLNPGGFAQVTLNWTHNSRQSPESPIKEAIHGANLDALLLWNFSLNAWQYARYWIQNPVNSQPVGNYHGASWLQILQWAAWLRSKGVHRVAFGSLHMHRRTKGAAWFRSEKVSSSFGDYAGAQLQNIFNAQEWLQTTSLLDETLILEPTLFSSATQKPMAGLLFPLSIHSLTEKLLAYLDGKATARTALAIITHQNDSALEKIFPLIEDDLRNLVRFGWLRRQSDSC